MIQQRQQTSHKPRQAAKAIQSNKFSSFWNLLGPWVSIFKKYGSLCSLYIHSAMTATLFSSREFARGKPLLLFVGGRSSSEVLANLQGQRLLRFSCQQSEASSRIAPQKRAFRHLAEMSAS